MVEESWCAAKRSPEDQECNKSGQKERRWNHVKSCEPVCMLRGGVALNVIRLESRSDCYKQGVHGVANASPFVRPYYTRFVKERVFGRFWYRTTTTTELI